MYTHLKKIYIPNSLIQEVVLFAAIIFSVDSKPNRSCLTILL